MVAGSSEFYLTLKRSHRVHFFQFEIRQKKRDILREKRESGITLKKLEFTPKSGNVDTYGKVPDHGTLLPELLSLTLIQVTLAIPVSPGSGCAADFLY